MPQSPDDELDRIEQEADRLSRGPLGAARRSDGSLRNAETDAWLAAGDNLAEKAIAALDTGDDERVVRLVRRIVALPVVDGSIRSGLMAVSILVINEVIDPTFEGGDDRGFLDLPLRLLPTLDRYAAESLRHALAVIADYDVPAAVLRRVREVVPLERRLDPPFADVPEEELEAAVTATLRLVLALRGADG